MSSQRVVRISEVELTLDQLVRAIRQLDPAARSEIAKALLETELDSELASLIGSLNRREPAEDITDADIVAEVKAVRKQRQREC